MAYVEGDPYTELGSVGGPNLARIRLIQGPATNTAAALKGRAGLLFGASVLVGASTGSILVYDGTDSSGPGVLAWGGTANDAKSYWYGPHGLWFRNGLYVSANSNITLQSIFWVDLYG
jgi:hypothetical protein